MSPLSFALLLGATALSVGLAANAITSRDVPLTARAAGERLKPDLIDRVNEARELRITGPGTARITLKGDGERWQVMEKGGFPAKPPEVRKLVLQLGNLELVEAKTALPERLPRLELEEPGKPEAKSRLVEILGSDGEPLAAAVVGKTQFGLYGGGRSGTYVRRLDASQAWLAAGALELPSDALDLVDTQVVDVPVADVARVTLGMGGPSPLVLHRAETGSQNFTVEATPPEGRTIDQGQVEEVAGMLAALSMQDVKPAAELAVPPDARRTRVETFDGLAVDVTLLRQGEGDAAEAWIQLAATTVAPAKPPPAPAEGAAPVPTPAERATALQERAEGWAFKVQPYLADRIGATLDTLLAEKPPAS